MLESEAKTKLLERIDDRAAVFCPLIKANCVKSCECFTWPEIYNYSDINDKESYDVRYGFCTCHALNGGCD